jgi:pseudo-response regulator 5
MGKVVLSSSSEEAGGMVELETEKKDIGSSEVVRWEKFLPKMVLRVLLVEADDSTRQIIVALLRKCGYRGFNFLLFTLRWLYRHFYFFVISFFCLI